MSKRNMITQTEAVFYVLYKKFKSAPGEYVPVHALMGEVFCDEVHKWGYVSYECSARASEIRKANPELIETTTIVGKSGARYYGYRITPTASPKMILDEKLLAFYKQIVGTKQMAV